MRKRLIVAISGMMGSGKTTLASNLARLLRWDSIPESLTAIKYLPDLFSDTQRWAYETQLAFLAEKGIQLLTPGTRAIVLDRSLQEDVQIFAQYWHDVG